MEKNIQYAGLSELNEEEKENSKVICEMYYDKINRKEKINDLKIHIKKKEKSNNENKKHRYEIIIKVNTIKKQYMSQKEDWGLTKTLRESFDKIIAEIEHNH